MIDKIVCAKLSYDVYSFDKELPPGWVRIDESGNDGEGFAGGAYYNATTNELVVAFRGSEHSRQDWIDNDFYGFGSDNLPRQFESAKKYYEKIRDQIVGTEVSVLDSNGQPVVDENGNEVKVFVGQQDPEGDYSVAPQMAITGHSLGGGLAQLVGALSENSSIQTYTYNAIGAEQLLDELAKSYSIAGTYGNINNYMVVSDFASSLFNSIGTDHYVSSFYPIDSENISKKTLVINGTQTVLTTLIGDIYVTQAHSMENFTATGAFQETSLPNLSRTVFDVLKLIKGDAALTHAVTPILLPFLKGLLFGIDCGTKTTKSIFGHKIVHNTGMPTGGASAVTNTLPGEISYYESIDNTCNALMNIDVPFIVKALDDDNIENDTIIVDDPANAGQIFDNLIGTGHECIESYYMEDEILFEKSDSAIEIKVTTDKTTYTSIENLINASNQIQIAVIEKETGNILIGDSGSQSLTEINPAVFNTEGNDTIYGNDGNDKLNGQAGNDMLFGGKGNDVYTINSGDGQDVITDSDGRGVILYGGQYLSGGVKSENDVNYTDSNGNTYSLNGSTLVINGTTTVTDFVKGKLGITLKEEKPDDPDIGQNDYNDSRKERRFDPLVLDMDGDGIELLSLDQSNAYFDLDGDNFRERTGWVNKDDALLVLDKNNNGQIDGISELFGSPNQIGFEILKELDTDLNNVLDKDDMKFNQLKVWNDLNNDGLAEETELRTLNEAGIISINLDYSKIYELNKGNTISEVSTYYSYNL